MVGADGHAVGTGTGDVHAGHDGGAIADRRYAHAQAQAAAGLAGVAGSHVLQRGDVQVAPHIGVDPVGLHGGADQVQITACADVDGVACRDLAGVVLDLSLVVAAFALGYADLEAQAVLRAHAQGGAHAGAAAAVAAGGDAGVPARLQR